MFLCCRSSWRRRIDSRDLSSAKWSYVEEENPEDIWVTPKGVDLLSGPSGSLILSVLLEKTKVSVTVSGSGKMF